MKAQSHAAAAAAAVWELSLSDEAISLTLTTDSLYNPPSPRAPRDQLRFPDTKHGAPASLASCPTCLQVQRDPRLVDVRGVALGADPPDRSAVYLLLRGRRHVPPAGQSTGDRRDCERFGAAAATRAHARPDGVGGGRAIVMVMVVRRERENERERLAAQ